MKTKDIKVDDKTVTIWRMNFGFKTDYQGDTTKTVWIDKKDPNTGRVRKIRDVIVDNGKLILYTLLYGIYKSDDFGILPPTDLELGFTPEEKDKRLRIIRGLNINTDLIYEEINNINGEVEEELLKK